MEKEERTRIAEEERLRMEMVLHEWKVANPTEARLFEELDGVQQGEKSDNYFPHNHFTRGHNRSGRFGIPKHVYHDSDYLGDLNGGYIGERM